MTPTGETRIHEIAEDGQAILFFKGEFGFLSNFKRAVILADGQEYPTLEQAYQAMKTLNAEAREAIRRKSNPLWARQAARAKSFVVQDGWGAMRVGVMRDLLVQKFTRHPDLAAKLLATGDRLLAEGNAWSDREWGVCRDEDGVWRGQNLLGVLLMEVRDALATGRLTVGDGHWDRA